MAGWKLRKDKAAAEAADTDVETTGPALETQTAVAEKPPLEEMPNVPVFLDTPPTLLEFDTEAEPHFSGLSLGREPEAPIHVDGGGPLTLVDYTEPTPAASETHAHSYDAPSFDMPAIAVPPIETPEPAAIDFSLPLVSEKILPESDDEAEFEPIHTSSWLSSDFSTGIPAVAPFVLDAPVPEVPAAAPRLVVRFGQLSATFEVVKDVTTIGRPDSALHYYPDIEIEMDDAVSRRHAEVVRRADGYYLVDTGSTNGTTLNGEMLLPHQERRLVHGDRIRVGDRAEITFE